MQEYDVIVIGAGPAGATTAAAMVAESDLHTLLIEKETLPGPKICGGAVSQYNA